MNETLKLQWELFSTIIPHNTDETWLNFCNKTIQTNNARKRGGNIDTAII